MNARDEARRVIHTAHCLEIVHNDDCMFWEDDATSADALLASGYRKPRTITTVEELNALDEGSAYLMADGTVGRPRGWPAISHAVFSPDGGIGALRAESVPLPVTVVYVPESEA